MVKHKTNDSKKMNPVLWFLFVIVIPLVVLITLTIFILSIAGISVMDWAKDKANDLPVVSSILKEDAEPLSYGNEKQLQANNSSKNAEIEELNQHIQEMEATIEQLEHEVVKLENNPNDKHSPVNDEADRADNDPIKSVSSSFKDMDKQQAALIIQRLEKDTAVSLLKEVSNKVRGSILEAMDPKVAAELTQLFINSEQ